MKPVRAACGLFVAACMSTLILGNLPRHYLDAYANEPKLIPSPLTLYQTGENGPRDTLGAIVQDAGAEGGQVVMCKHHVCLDLATHEDMGQSQDGYYILFSRSDPHYEEKLQKYQERIRNWVERN